MAIFLIVAVAHVGERRAHTYAAKLAWIDVWRAASVALTVTGVAMLLLTLFWG